MRTLGWKLGSLAALACLMTAATANADDKPTAADGAKAAAQEQAAEQAAKAPAEKSAFDMNLQVADTSSKAVTLERTGPARDFIQRAAIYLRYIPVDRGERQHPAWINTHNYLTCPDKGDKRWPLEGVSRVDFDKSSAIAVYGFFFSRPECDTPTFHMEAIIAGDEKYSQKKS